VGDELGAMVVAKARPRSDADLVAALKGSLSSVHPL
jgi:hypothetical protein